MKKRRDRGTECSNNRNHKFIFFILVDEDLKMNQKKKKKYMYSGWFQFDAGLIKYQDNPKMFSQKENL